MPLRFRDERVKHRNPRISEVRSIRPAEPLNESVLSALEVPNGVRAPQPDKNGYLTIEFKVGCVIELHVRNLEKGWMAVPGRGLSYS